MMQYVFIVHVKLNRLVEINWTPLQKFFFTHENFSKAKEHTGILCKIHVNLRTFCMQAILF